MELRGAGAGRKGKKGDRKSAVMTVLTGTQLMAGMDAVIEAEEPEGLMEFTFSER